MRIRIYFLRGGEGMYGESSIDGVCHVFCFPGIHSQRPAQGLGCLIFIVWCGEKRRGKERGMVIDTHPCELR